MIVAGILDDARHLAPSHCLSRHWPAAPPIADLKLAPILEPDQVKLKHCTLRPSPLEGEGGEGGRATSISGGNIARTQPPTLTSP